LTAIQPIRRTCTRIALLAVCSAATLAAAENLVVPQPVQNVAKQMITRDVLEASIRFLSSDALEGRGPASRGDELARLYLATELEKLGYEPGGPNGEWQQRFDIVGVTARVPGAWTFKAKGKDLELKWGEDYIVASGVQEEKSVVSDAELVFVGYGIQAPEYRWDDYKGMNLKGKVLVMLNNDPEGDPKLFEGDRRLYYGRWTYKYESAARQGDHCSYHTVGRLSLAGGANLVER
jgi:hypothetical protein